MYPISRAVPRFNDPHTLNHFTSACGVTFIGTICSGGMFDGQCIRVRAGAQPGEPDGGGSGWVDVHGGSARRGRAAEFLASTDNWFRPTATVRWGRMGRCTSPTCTGSVIEHPEWIPPDWQKKLDLRAGHDKGRIYRVSPMGVERRPIPRLDKMDTAGLAAALDSSSGWQRDMGQRLLVHRQD